MGCAFSAVLSSSTLPESQKPSSSTAFATTDFVGCAGPNGVVGTWPSQAQRPSKTLSCAISLAGAGGGAGAAGFPAMSPEFPGGTELDCAKAAAEADKIRDVQKVRMVCSSRRVSPILLSARPLAQAVAL